MPFLNGAVNIIGLLQQQKNYKQSRYSQKIIAE